MPVDPTHNPFAGPLPPQPARPKKTPALLVVIAALPALACATVVVKYMLDSRGHEAIDPLRRVCAGQPALHAAPYPLAGPSAIPRRLGWFERGGGDQWAYRSEPPVPRAWRTLWADEAQLVVCAEPVQTQVIERCALPDGRTIERRQEQQTLRLQVASSGQVLLQQTVTGGAPQTCADTPPMTGNTRGVVHTGAPVSEAIVGPLFEPFVLR